MLILLERYASNVNLETLQQALLLISNILALSFLVEFFKNVIHLLYYKSAKTCSLIPVNFLLPYIHTSDALLVMENICMGGKLSNFLFLSLQNGTLTYCLSPVCFLQILIILLLFYNFFCLPNNITAKTKCGIFPFKGIQFCKVWTHIKRAY